MERRVRTALDAVDETLTEEQMNSRFDIYYCTTGNKHVIIELKRANRVLTTNDLHEQISKYYGATENVLAAADRKNEPIEVICVIGRRLRDWDESPSGEVRSRKTLRANNARIVTYDGLIDNALKAYQDYVDRGEEAGRVYRLIQEISEPDAQAINPTHA